MVLLRKCFAYSVLTLELIMVGPFFLIGYFTAPYINAFKNGVKIGVKSVHDTTEKLERMCEDKGVSNEG
jgi:hypothetical protein